MQATKPKPEALVTLCAIPYNGDAKSKYFTEQDETFSDLVEDMRDAYGQPVEEFMIEFIDGSDLDFQLFKALKVCQPTVEEYLNTAIYWEDHEKIQAIIGAGEIGIEYDLNDPDQKAFDDVIYYQVDSLTDLAEQFIDEGLLGEIPEHLQSYIDVEKFANDLSFDYGEVTIDGETYFYTAP